MVFQHLKWPILIGVQIFRQTHLHFLIVSPPFGEMVIFRSPPWLWTQLTNEDSLISKGPWDIIIDNGSSAAGQMLFRLFSLWNTLAPGGVYIIQNLHANFGVNEVAAENPGGECWPGCCRILWAQLGSLNSKTMQLCNFATRWYPADLRRIHDLQSTCLHPIVEMVPCNCNMPFTCLLHALKNMPPRRPLANQAWAVVQKIEEIQQVLMRRHLGTRDLSVMPGDDSLISVEWGMNLVSWWSKWRGTLNSWVSMWVWINTY